VKAGRCEACRATGHQSRNAFLADVYVPCDVCKGKRYNRETLEIRFKGKNIQEILDMTVEDALPFFSAVPTVQPKLQTCSMWVFVRAAGPERHHALRRRGAAVKLAKELSKRATDARSTFSNERPPVCISPTSHSCWWYCSAAR